MEFNGENTISQNAQVVLIATIAFIAICSIYFVFRSSKDSRKLPPKSKVGMFKTINTFMDGSVYEFIVHEAKALDSKVFILNGPPVGPPVILVCDAKFSRQLFEEAEEKHAAYKMFDGITNNYPSILSKSTYGEDWGVIRKYTAPSFSTLNILKCLPVMYKKVDELKGLLRSHAIGNTSFDCSDVMTRMTVDFISSAMFDRDFNALMDENSIGKQMIYDMKLCMREFGLKQALNPIRKYVFWSKEINEAKEASKRLMSYQQEILNHYRTTHSEAETKTDFSILGHVIRCPYKSDHERCADMLIYVIAGHDSTAYSLSWTLIEVARHKDVYTKIKSEIDTHIPQGTEHITTEQLNNLKYLDNVINESMRLWPVIALGSGRITPRDMVYQSEDGRQEYIIPKGCMVNIPFFAVNRLANISNPDQFNPDRWSEDSPDLARLNELCFPFALGKRNCIGQNLAKLEVKMVLASLYQSFSFQLESELRLEYFMTLKPLNAFLSVHITK